MPINPFDPAMQGLQGAVMPGTRFQQSGVQGRFSNPLDPNATVFPPDTDAALAALQDQRKTELERNVATGASGVQGPINLQDLQSDIQKNPLTQQAADVKGINAGNLQAMLQGFRGGPVRQVTGDTPQASGASFESGIVDSPVQQMAKVGRAAEAAKTQIPLQVEQVRAGGLSDVERLKMQQQTGQTDQLMKFFQSGGVPVGGEVDIPGGGKIRQAPIPPLMGEEAKNVDALMSKRTLLDNPNAAGGGSGLANMLTGGRLGSDVNTQKAALERQLDVVYPTWRSRMAPGFKFATGANQAAQPSTNRITRPLKSGGTAYSDDGGKTWLADQ